MSSNSRRGSRQRPQQNLASGLASEQQFQDSLSGLTGLYRNGQNGEVLQSLQQAELSKVPDEIRSQLLVIKGAAEYDFDDITAAISSFREGLEAARSASSSVQFSAAFALFTRECELQPAEHVLPVLSELRQLAASIGSREAIGALHLAVARREGMRGNFTDARRHADLARRLAEPGADVPTLCSLDTVESSLDMMSGNLVRARSIAERGLRRAHQAGFVRYVAGCATNLSAISVWTGDVGRAREYVAQVLHLPQTSNRIRFCALDNLIQIALFEGDQTQGSQLLNESARIQLSLGFPRPSWYELSHQGTKCQFRELVGDWKGVIALVDEVEQELAERQLRTLRTVLFCAKARALSWVGEHDAAEATLAVAQRTCPRGGTRSPNNS